MVLPPHQVDPASSSLGFGCTHVREEHALQGPGLVSNHELHELFLLDQHTFRAGRRSHGTLDDLRQFLRNDDRCLGRNR